MGLRGATERVKGGVNNERQRGVELTQDQPAERRGSCYVLCCRVTG